MKAIYQKNYNLFLRKLNTGVVTNSLIDLGYGHWNGQSPAISHTSYSINHSWKQSYCSPLHHVNLHDLHSAEQVNQFPFVLVRDGLFLLLDFFHRFPEPSAFRPFFIIHSAFAGFIPESWQKKVLIYDFLYRPDGKIGMFGSTKKHYLIKGMFNEEITDHKKTLETINSCSKSGKTSVALFMKENPFLHSKWQGNDLLYSFAIFMEKIKKSLKNPANVDFITYDQAYKMKNLSDVEFCDVNSKENYYVDEYFNFFLLKNGASMMKSEISQEKSKEGKGKFVRLTPMHGIFVHENFELTQVKGWKNFETDFLALTEGEQSKNFNLNHFALINQHFSKNLKCMKYLT